MVSGMRYFGQDYSVGYFVFGITSLSMNSIGVLGILVKMLVFQVLGI